MDRMPLAKQEQFIAELVAKSKQREAMTPEQRAAEDAETMRISMAFNRIMETMDP